MDARHPEVQRENGHVTILDGKQAYGMIALTKATQEAIQRALQHGSGIVGLNNTSSSTGALGWVAILLGSRNRAQRRSSQAQKRSAI